MVRPRSTRPLQGAKVPDIAEARSWIGSRVIDANGGGVGQLEDVWIDESTGQPAWLLIRAGRLSRGRKLAPFAGATGGEGQVWLPVSREQVRSSPPVKAQQLLSSSLERELRDHYATERSQQPNRGAGS